MTRTMGDGDRGPTQVPALLPTRLELSLKGPFPRPEDHTQRPFVLILFSFVSLSAGKDAVTLLRISKESIVTF